MSNRQLARAAGETRYRNGKPCPDGHVAERMVSNGRCVVCLVRDKREYDRSPQGKKQIAVWQKTWRDQNKELVAQREKGYTQKFKQLNGISRSSAYKRRRLESDPTFRMIATLRSYFANWLRREGRHKCSSVPQMLGCSKEFFRQHIESQFLPGMDWNNHGLGRGKWHVDHRRSLKLVGSNPEDIKAAWHYSNLQPLWQEENIRKGRYA